MANSNYHFLEVPTDLVKYVSDKSISAKSYFRYLLSRTMMMFKYTNLPDTIDPQVFERMLQINGVCCITEANGDLRCFSGNISNKLDIYYRPTHFIIANPWLTKEGFSKDVVIYGDEPHTGVLFFNDSEWQGLTPIISRYASLLSENTVTVRIADIMLRKTDIIVAASDVAKKSADVFLKKLERGELAAISDSAFYESVKTLPTSSYNGSYLIQFIELQQYLKGSFYNELGLRANYNMKREAIGEGESTLDADSVLPLCENMLASRRKAIGQLNELFDLNVSVDYNSVWLENHIDSYLSIYNKISEAFNQSSLGQPNIIQGNFGQPNTSQNNFGQPSSNPEGQSQMGSDEDQIRGELGANEGQVDAISDEKGDKDDIRSEESRELQDLQETGWDSKDERGHGVDERADGSDGEGNDTNEGPDETNGNQAGENRIVSGDGVGRSLEGTGQDEELIELEEVVEKMIDEVYDNAVGQPKVDNGLEGGDD